MRKILDTDYLSQLLGWTLLGLLLSLLALEGWRYGVKPSEANNAKVIDRSLTKATTYFLDKQEELLNESENLAATLRRPLLQKRSSQYLHNTLTQSPQFWGAALYRGNTPVVWDGFALQNSGDIVSRNTSQTNSVSLEKHNNIIYWEFHVPFSVRDSAGTLDYDLITRYRIDQSNPLPIGGANEFNLFNSSELSTAYPLNFSIFSSAPKQYSQARQLESIRGDSVGMVYATADQFQETQKQWQQNTRFWRSIFALLCFVVLSCLLYWAADRLYLWWGLALQLLFIGIGWNILAYTNMPSYWVLTLADFSGPELTASVESLSITCTNALFALLASVTIARKLRNFNPKISADSYLSTISFAALGGIVNTLSIITVFELLFHASVASNVPLLDLRIFPEWGTIILYLALGMGILALGIILISINALLLRASGDQFKLSGSVMTGTFIFSLLTAELTLSTQLTFYRMLFIGTLSFAVATAFAVAYSRHMIRDTQISPLRKIVVGSFVIAALALPAIYQASLINTDDELFQTARNFAEEQDPFAAKLTENLLTSLEDNFREINEEDLRKNRSTLQARFTETIQNFVSPQMNTYSFDLQLVDSTGQLISDYSTDLNSPNWLKLYNISTLKAVTEIQQITKSTNRPVVQQPQLINQQDYRTFYRGWIPVFGTSEDTPIAWILCSVYQERPEFNKPIRAVMASLTYDDWNQTYYMQKFNNQQLVSSVQQGFAGYYPKKQTLTEREMEALQTDSLIYVTEQTTDYDYRTLLWRESGSEIIKVTTTLSDYRVILFTFFRISFILLLAGCAITLLGMLFSGGTITFMGRNKKFQDRILDSFLLATLVFLAFLIVTSHYAIKQQNRDIVRQELFDKLESLSTAVESNRNLNRKMSLSNSFSLDTLTTPLNVDASFYNDRTVSETTTPQIYQQHLLPSALPFEIFNKLYIQRQQDAFSMVNLAGQSLLIGYRSILNAQNQPVATIAIPTFLESPKYDQQLLETTSYLILIYLLVFGLFIIGSMIISKKLTRPLVYIQRGLNKISAGNLNTTIPVTSKDEIGNLARAYNNMVDRLKKLQKELASAEREAAWKEMAQQVAHEIKNPLTPMKLNVQHLERQLKSDGQDPEKLKERVQKITNNLIEQIQTLNNIASDFSKFSQPLEEDFRRVNLVDIVSSVSELYEHDEKVEIKMRSQKNALFVQGIEDELRRVIINLVKNSYEAMPDSGGEIVLRLYQKQRHVFLEVEDNGHGIAEEDRPNIFVPNFSTKSSGTGLGLAICKKIIEAHEGSISFASVEGEGTTFVIKLPQD